MVVDWICGLKVKVSYNRVLEIEVIGFSPKSFQVTKNLFALVLKAGTGKDPSNELLGICAALLQVPLL